MPTSKVIRPAVFDETGEHVIPADADLNLDPVSSDPDNYIVRGSDGGAFLNGDGVLSNDGENLLKTSPNDGKVTYPRSDAVDLIRDTMQAALDAADERINNAQDTADKAQATADKAAEDAAAAQCTATQALNDAADAQADADKAQARADAAYDRASDAQCAAADALDKAKEAVDKLPEIAAEHVTVITAGDGIKVDHTKNFSHNVYQVSVKRNGEDSGLISSTDGLEVELKGNGGLDKDKDGLYVDQQWIDEMVARYAKDHMLFNQIKVVRQLPEIPDADVHTIYLIRNKDSSATDVGTKDSFDGWIIVATENGTQKWEEVGYKTDLTGYTHAGNTVKLTGDATGTGTVDANGSVVVPTAVSHAASADKTTGGTVRITGYVSGSGSFDRNGNVTVDVVPNIADTPSTWYVGKTNARDYWGKDENGNQWGSTKDHPFASLSYAVNASNKHIFPGNSINIIVLDAGEYDEGWVTINVSSSTYISADTSSHPAFRGGFEINMTNSELSFDGIDFYIRNITAVEQAYNGQIFIRTYGDGTLTFRHSCHMVIDSDNLGMNLWGFIRLYDNTELETDIDQGQTALYLELKNNGTVRSGGLIYFADNAEFSSLQSDSEDVPAIKVNAPAGTKLYGYSIYLSRFADVEFYGAANLPHYRVYMDWDIADDSSLQQVNLGAYARLVWKKNPNKGQALPGNSVGSVPSGAEFTQVDWS